MRVISAMKNKIKLAILFGGQSAEHEVSLQSAKNVIDALDTTKYEVMLIGIDKQGRWHVNDNSEFLLNYNDPKLIALNKTNIEVALVPGSNEQKVVSRDNTKTFGDIDVVLPILHGPLGEDGTVQGFLKLANIPFVGSSVLGSAVCMDKDVAKRLLTHAGLPICKHLTLKKNKPLPLFSDVVNKLGLPIFVKPANMGSSIGISKIRNESEYQEALNLAFSYDNKILVEECVKGREIEVSILGNDNPSVSTAGEIISKNDFYSYESKYIDEHGATLVVPAKIDKDTLKEIQDIAKKAFEVLECEDLARCDFFLCDNGKILINEMNTIPGFTNISMYPKLWEASGVSYSELIDKLIQISMERYKNQ